MKNTLSTFSMIATLFVALGCQAVREVGSACPDGVCSQAAPNRTAAVPCLVSSVVAEIAIDPGADELVCLPRPLHRHVDGEVPCTLQWNLRTEDESWCTDLGFSVHHGDSAVVGEVRCDVPQVPVHDGALADVEASGWYYDDFTEETQIGCTGLEKQRISLTQGLVAPDGVYARLSCAQAVAAAEDAAPALGLPVETVDLSISSCMAPIDNDATDVGAACTPRVVPEGGFDDVEAYLQTGADDCEAGTCLVYHLSGSTHESCEAAGDSRCATDDEIAERVYCTCRCDDGAGGGCDCPDGFSCVHVIDNVSERFNGGYCVRNTSVTTQ